MMQLNQQETELIEDIRELKGLKRSTTFILHISETGQIKKEMNFKADACYEVIKRLKNSKISNRNNNEMV